jgi:hypothetical protein
VTWYRIVVRANVVNFDDANGYAKKITSGSGRLEVVSIAPEEGPHYCLRCAEIIAKGGR